VSPDKAEFAAALEVLVRGRLASRHPGSAWLSIDVVYGAVLATLNAPSGHVERGEIPDAVRTVWAARDDGRVRDVISTATEVAHRLFAEMHAAACATAGLSTVDSTRSLS
jgi:hypothetical protein